MWVITIATVLMGISELIYAFKRVEKENKPVRSLFIGMGIATIIMGLLPYLLLV